jgi:hypothetical protein
MEEEHEHITSGRERSNKLIQYVQTVSPFIGEEISKYISTELKKIIQDYSSEISQSYELGVQEGRK